MNITEKMAKYSLLSSQKNQQKIINFVAMLGEVSIGKFNKIKESYKDEVDKIVKEKERQREIEIKNREYLETIDTLVYDDDVFSGKPLIDSEGKKVSSLYKKIEELKVGDLLYSNKTDYGEIYGLILQRNSNDIIYAEISKRRSFARSNTNAEYEITIKIQSVKVAVVINILYNTFSQKLSDNYYYEIYPLYKLYDFINELISDSNIDVNNSNIFDTTLPTTKLSYFKRYANVPLIQYIKEYLTKGEKIPEEYIAPLRYSGGRASVPETKPQPTKTPTVENNSESQNSKSMSDLETLIYHFEDIARDYYDDIKKKYPNSPIRDMSFITRINNKILSSDRTQKNNFTVLGTENVIWMPYTQKKFNDYSGMEQFAFDGNGNLVNNKHYYDNSTIEVPSIFIEIIDKYRNKQNDKLNPIQHLFLDYNKLNPIYKIAKKMYDYDFTINKLQYTMSPDNYKVGASIDISKYAQAKKYWRAIEAKTFDINTGIIKGDNMHLEIEAYNIIAKELGLETKKQERVKSELEILLEKGGSFYNGIPVKYILNLCFPRVNFSVKSDSYSGGCSINISTNTQLSETDAKRITDVILRFGGRGFDGMTDSSYQNSSKPFWINGKEITLSTYCWVSPYDISRKGEKGVPDKTDESYKRYLPEFKDQFKDEPIQATAMPSVEGGGSAIQSSYGGKKTIQIRFRNKPSDSILSMIKAKKFKWYGKYGSGYWGAFYTDDLWNWANDFVNGNKLGSVSLGGIEDEPQIEIEEIYPDERGNKKYKNKQYSFNYSVEIDGKLIELDGVLIPYNSGRSIDYKVELGSYSKHDSEYIDENWEMIEEQILDKLNEHLGSRKLKDNFDDDDSEYDDDDSFYNEDDDEGENYISPFSITVEPLGNNEFEVEYVFYDEYDEFYDDEDEHPYIHIKGKAEKGKVWTVFFVDEFESDKAKSFYSKYMNTIKNQIAEKIDRIN